MSFTEHWLYGSEQNFHVPHCSIHLQVPSVLSLTLPFRFTVQLRHHANVTGNPHGKPITIKLRNTLKSFESVHLGGYLLLHTSDTGVNEIPVDHTRGFEPDDKYPRGRERETRFITIAPGRSHTEEIRFPVENFELEVGQKYHFLYRGGSIEWWEWGTVEELGERKVQAQTWERSGDSNRPCIDLPASNTVEFTTVA
jgi:hypothetical protein